MAGPFYPPSPILFPALPDKSVWPGATTRKVKANAVGGARKTIKGLQTTLNTSVNGVQHEVKNAVGVTAYGYKYCGNKDEEGVVITDHQRKDQEGVDNHTEPLNPNPVDQGHDAQQSQSWLPPPFPPVLDVDPGLNIPAEYVANVELNDSWFNGYSGADLFNPVSLSEAPEGALGPAGQETQHHPPDQQETSEPGPTFDGDSSAKPENVNGRHEATINDIHSGAVKASTSTSYFENGIEYQEAEAKLESKKKEEKKSKKPRKKQQRNKVPRQNSAAARKDPENYTLPMLDQMHWSVENLPDIMYQLKPVGEKGRRPKEKKPSPFPGEKDLTVFPILPDRISSNVEEFRLEAWLRLDRRIELKDIAARIIPRCRPNTNAIQQRTVRFRKAMKMVCWGTGNRQTPILSEEVVRQLIQKGIDPAKNSTRGLTPGLIDPSRGEVGGRIPVPRQYKQTEANAPPPPPPQSYIDLGLKVPSHVIESWETRLSPYEYAVALQHQEPGGWYGIWHIAELQAKKGPEYGPFIPGSLPHRELDQKALPPAQTHSQTQAFNAGFAPGTGISQQTFPALGNQGTNGCPLNSAFGQSLNTGPVPWTGAVQQGFPTHQHQGYPSNPAFGQSFSTGPIPWSGAAQQDFPTPENEVRHAGLITDSATSQPVFSTNYSSETFPTSPVPVCTGTSTVSGQVSFKNGEDVKEENHENEIVAQSVESVENQHDEHREETQEQAGSEDNYDEENDGESEVEADDEDEYENEDEYEGDDEYEDEEDDDESDSVDDEVQTSDSTASGQEEKSSDEDSEIYLHYLAYWDKVYSTKEFGDFGHQAVLIPDSPPLFPPERPGRPCPTTREAVIRAQTDRNHQPRPMTNDTIRWGSTILTDAPWVPNMPALDDYEGQAAFETGLESIGHHPYLAPGEPAFWDRNFLPSRALAGYMYSEPRIQAGATFPTPRPQPSLQPQSLYQPQPLLQLKRRRDENDCSVNRGQPRDQVKRRRLDGDESTQSSRHTQAHCFHEVARAVRYMNSSPLEQSNIDSESITGQRFVRVPSSQNGYLPLQPRAQTSMDNTYMPAQPRTQPPIANNYTSIKLYSQPSMDYGYMPAQPPLQPSTNNDYMSAQPRAQTSMNNGYMPAELY